jgi:hypothetical protein
LVGVRRGRGHFAAGVALQSAVAGDRPPRLKERHRHQQLPQVAATLQLVFPLLQPHAEAVIHALQNVFLVLAAAGAGVDRLAGQGQKLRKVALPDFRLGLPPDGGRAAFDFVQQSRDRAGRLHGETPGGWNSECRNQKAKFRSQIGG